MREVEHLSVDEQKRLNGLTKETLNDLLKKYHVKKGFLPKGKGRADG